MDEGALSEGRLKEYEMLRQELMHYDRSVLQVLGITLGFLGVITAQGIASGSPYVFVVALPLLIVVHSYVADKRWVIWTVASYLRRFVEDRDLGPRWETELYWFRTACRKVGGFTPGQNIMRVECALFALLGLMELALFANGAWQCGLAWWHYVLPAALCAWLVFQVVRNHCRLACEGRQGGGLKAVWDEADRLKSQEK